MLNKKNMKWTLLALLVVPSLFIFQNCGSPSHDSGGSDDQINGTSHTNDLDAPKVLLLDKPASITNNKNFTYQFVVEDIGSGVEKIQYKLDEGEWLTAGNLVVLKNLTDGKHAFSVHATDKNGNTSEVVTHNWTVDTKGPEISFTTFPVFITALKDADFAFTSTDATTAAKLDSCALDGVAIDCAKGKFKKLALALGTHVLKVIAKDSAGNLGQDTFSWAIVANANEIPEPVFAKAPSAFTKLSAPVLNIKTIEIGSMAGASLVCTLDAKAVVCPDNRDFALSGLLPKPKVAGKDVPYVFTAKLVVKNKSSKVTTTKWIVDTTKPTIAVPTRMTVVDPRDSITVLINASDDSGAAIDVRCAVDGAEIVCDDDKAFIISNIAAGKHKLEIDAIDSAGNITEATINWERPSCAAPTGVYTWPVAGRDGVDWGIRSFFDLNANVNQKKDFSNAADDAARVIDNASSTYISFGDFQMVENANHVTTDAGKIFAMDSGLIESVNDTYESAKVYANRGACTADQKLTNTITILHDNGYRTTYHFIKKFSARIPKNSRVNKGDWIADVGSSGCHQFVNFAFTVKNCNGTAIDPLQKLLFNNPPLVYNTDPQVTNLTIHTGLLVESVQADLNKLIVTPVPLATYPINKGITVKLMLSGQQIPDKMKYELIKPNGSSVVLSNGTVGASIGHMLVFRYNSLNVAGTWKFRASYIKNVKLCQDSPDDCISRQISFPVN